MAVFGIVMTVVVTLMQLYVFWRASSLPFLGHGVPNRILWGSGTVLWILFFVVRTYGYGTAEFKTTNTLFTVLSLIGMDWLGMLLLFSISFLAADILTGFGFLLPGIISRMRLLALFAGGILSVIAVVQGMRSPVIDSYDIDLPHLPSQLDGTVIVAVSDLHLGTLIGTQWLSDRADQIREQHPDLVVMVGDIFDGRIMPDGDLLSAMHRITAPLGVWVVQGNHDVYGDWNQNEQMLTAAGYQMLNDRWAEVRPGFILAGVEDLTIARRTGQDEAKVVKALANRPPGATVFLSHTPWHAEMAASSGVGLMLSAHTHGGQIWPFGELVKLRYPLLEGLYPIGRTSVIVCRGTGTWGPRMRLWHPGEILRITLHASRDT